MRIVVADDHALFRAGLRSALLEAFGEKTTILEAADLAGLSALLAKEDGLDLILCDLRMPDMDPQQGVDGLVRLRPETPVVVVSASEQSEDACRSIRQGAKGYIPKSDSLEVLQRALELILAGGVYAPARALVAAQEAALEAAGEGGAAAPSAAEPRGAGPCAMPALSNRQMMIFERLADGKPNKTIARELGIAEGTVKAQLRTVFRKLGVNNRTQAALFAAQVLGREAAPPPGGATAADDAAAAEAGEPGVASGQPRLHGKFKVFDFPS